VPATQRLRLLTNRPRPDPGAIGTAHTGSRTLGLRSGIEASPQQHNRRPTSPMPRPRANVIACLHRMGKPTRSPEGSGVMYRIFIALATFASAIGLARADEYSEMAQFAQSICGDIPEGSLTRTTIQGKVQANAGVFAKIVSGSGDLCGSKVDEIYKGIPFEKLPDHIPTVSMCKSELVKILLQRKKMVANRCRLPDFGQEGWNRSETYTDSSGRLDGGHDQNWWCNQVAASFIGSRAIGPQNHWNRVSSHEESDKDWKGHVTYKYHCTINVSWDPRYIERQDTRCGFHEE
jgi:hypothetical protein